MAQKHFWRATRDPITVPAYVDDSQTIAAGMALSLTSGKVSAMASGAASFHGIALTAKTTTTSGATDIITIMPGSTVALIGGFAHTPDNIAITLLGTDIDFVITSTFHRFDENASTDAVFRVIALPTKDAAGTFEDFIICRAVAAQSTY